MALPVRRTRGRGSKARRALEAAPPESRHRGEASTPAQPDLEGWLRRARRLGDISHTLPGVQPRRAARPVPVPVARGGGPGVRRAFVYSFWSDRIVENDRKGSYYAQLGGFTQVEANGLKCWANQRNEDRARFLLKVWSYGELGEETPMASSFSRPALGGSDALGLFQVASATVRDYPPTKYTYLAPGASGDLVAAWLQRVFGVPVWPLALSGVKRSHLKALDGVTEEGTRLAAYFRRSLGPILDDPRPLLIFDATDSGATFDLLTALVRKVDGHEKRPIAKLSLSFTKQAVRESGVKELERSSDEVGLVKARIYWQQYKEKVPRLVPKVPVEDVLSGEVEAPPRVNVRAAAGLAEEVDAMATGLFSGQKKVGENELLLRALMQQLDLNRAEAVRMLEENERDTGSDDDDEWEWDGDQGTVDYDPSSSSEGEGQGGTGTNPASVELKRLDGGPAAALTALRPLPRHGGSPVVQRLSDFWVADWYDQLQKRKELREYPDFKALGKVLDSLERSDVIEDETDGAEDLIRVLGERLLKADDVGAVYKAIAYYFPKSYLRPEDVRAVKSYNFDGPIMFTAENYVAWTRLARGEGTVDDLRYIHHEIFELKRLKQGEHAGGVSEKDPEDSFWQEGYQPAHEGALGVEMRFLTHAVNLIYGQAFTWKHVARSDRERREDFLPELPKSEGKKVPTMDEEIVDLEAIEESYEQYYDEGLSGLLTQVKKTRLGKKG